MNITIHGKNLDITPLIETAVTKSLRRIEKFKKFIDSSTTAKVEVSSYPEKNYKVTVNITLPYKKNLHCEVKNEDLLVAIKNVVHPLIKQLQHLKDSGKGALSAGEFIQEKDEEDFEDYEITELL